jgi:hypothetical protein
MPTFKETPAMSKVQKHLSLLGHRVRDRVTGLDGVVTSVCFDLYGCIQAVIHPGLGVDGKIAEQNWFDVNRLIVISTDPVMTQPNFVEGPVADGQQGAAAKPPVPADFLHRG